MTTYVPTHSTFVPFASIPEADLAQAISDSFTYHWQHDPAVVAATPGAAEALAAVEAAREPVAVTAAARNAHRAEHAREVAHPDTLASRRDEIATEAAALEAAYREASAAHREALEAAWRLLYVREGSAATDAVAWAAARADEQHAAALAAHAALVEALEAREAAYRQAGRPDVRSHWSVSGRVYPNREHVLRSLASLVEDFPPDVAGKVAALAADPDALTVTIRRLDADGNVLPAPRRSGRFRLDEDAR